MQGVKTSWVGRSFALAVPSNSHGRQKSSRRRTKEERRIMIESFVEKYKASNKGEFPPVTLTQKEVGGSFYTVREILEALKQDSKPYDPLGTDLEVIEIKNKTKRHAIQPLSLPEENCVPICRESSGVIDNNHSLEIEEAKYQEALSEREEQKNILHNDVMQSWGQNDRTQAKQEITTVERPLGTNATSVVMGLQSLQEETRGETISSMNGGFIDSNHRLELKEENNEEALADTEEKKNIIHNDGMESCGQNDQIQAKQEIKIVESPLVTGATSVVDLRPLQDVANGRSISNANGGFIGSNQSIGLKETEYEHALSHTEEKHEAKYQEALADTEEEKIIIHDDVVETSDMNGQAPAEEEVKIVETPLGTSSATLVVGLQSLQDLTKEQSISTSGSGVIYSNNDMELKEAKSQEALSDAEEQKNVVHDDLMETCGSNNQSQAEQNSEIIERQQGIGAASVLVDENEKNKTMYKPTILFQTSETKNVTNRNMMESYPSSMENLSMHEASELKEQEHNLIHDLSLAASISPRTDVCLPDLQSSYELASDSLEKQTSLESLGELQYSSPMISENGSVLATQETTSSSSLEENSSYMGAYEGHEEHPLDMSKPLSFTSDTRSTTSTMEFPVDLPNSAGDEEENALLPNSTKEVLEESTTSADKISSSMKDSCTTPRKATEIPDNILEGQNLCTSNISAAEMLSGVQAFYRVLLHRLALSALIIQTLAAAEDVSKKGLSESESENIDRYPSSKYSSDQTNKNGTVMSVASPRQQSGIEGIGSIRQNSQRSRSDENYTNISENKNGTYKNTKTLEDLKKPETNIIVDIFTALANAIIHWLRK